MKTAEIFHTDGRPRAGLKVRLVPVLRLADYKRLPYDLDYFTPLLRVEAATDKDGRFRADGLLPGLPYQLAISAGEMSEAQVTVHLKDGALMAEPGKTKDLGDLKSTRNKHGKDHDRQGSGAWLVSQCRGWADRSLGWAGTTKWMPPGTPHSGGRSENRVPKAGQIRCREA